MLTTREAIRALIHHVELRPVEKDGQQTLAVDLSGHIAGILTLAAKGAKPSGQVIDYIEETTLVAGARNQRYQQGLFQAAA